MGLRETNLASILGSGRYHSIITTTYTIDPVFLKKIYVPLLQANRVRNIVILADKNELNKQLQVESNVQLLSDTSFLLLPASTSSLFHPKVTMLIGEKQGLLLVGSGNLTHSGMGGNKELWGAYHCNLENTENAHLFLDAWKFIEEYIPQLSGIGGEKTKDWFINYAPWFKDIITEGNSATDSNTSILVNNKTSTIWDTFKAEIEKNEIDEIIIASPYFDKNARIVNEISRLQPNAKIKVIFDEFGMPPKVNEPLDQVTCYSWQQLNPPSKEGNISTKRLHAKLFLAKLKNGNEIILFGSANASVAGMGLDPTNNNTNSELSLLATGEKGIFTNALGINLTGQKGLKIEDIPSFSTATQEPLTKVISEKEYIIFAEQNGSRLCFDLNKEIVDKKFEITLTNTLGNNTAIEISTVEGTKSYETKLPFKEQIPKFNFIKLSESKRISVIYQRKLLNLDNPDPRSSDIQNILAEIPKESLGSLADLFSDLFSKLTKETKKITTGKSSGNKDLDGDNSEASEKHYTQEEFEEKKKSNIYQHSNSVFIEGAFAIQNALDEMFKLKSNKEISNEATASNSSEEIETNEEEANNPEEIKQKSISETQLRVKKYRSYFNKAVSHFEQTDMILKNSDSEKRAMFLSNWTLVNAIAVHIIRIDLLEDPNNYEDGLNGKTTIQPYDSDKELSIDDIVKKLILGIVGRVNKKEYGININEYLDQEKRKDAALKFALLLILRRWKTPKHLLSAFKNTIEIFGMGNGVGKGELINSLVDELKFYKTIKLSDWRYHQNVQDNLETLKGSFE